MKKLAKIALICLLLTFFPIEEYFANTLTDAIVEQIFSEFFTLRFKPFRVGFHRGYFLYPWRKGIFLNVGYSFGIGAKGSFPYLFTVSFSKIFERVKLETAIWYPAVQLSSTLRILKFLDGGFLVGISSIVGYSHLLFLGYEISANLLVAEKQFAGYIGLRYMEPINQKIEVILPFVPLHQFRLVFGSAIFKFCFEGQLGVGDSGIFLLSGIAFMLYEKNINGSNPSLNLFH